MKALITGRAWVAVYGEWTGESIRMRDESFPSLFRGESPLEKTMKRYAREARASETAGETYNRNIQRNIRQQRLFVKLNVF